MTTAQTINLALTIPFLIITATILFIAIIRPIVNRATETRQSGQRPLWERCIYCDDFWCNKHEAHTHECDCPPALDKAAWFVCDCCGDFFCSIHRMHTGDCDCPPLEDWIEKGIDPYTEGGIWLNQTPSGQNRLPPSEDRWKLRAITYQGIADAMADQWGNRTTATQLTLFP